MAVRAAGLRLSMCVGSVSLVILRVLEFRCFCWRIRCIISNASNVSGEWHAKTVRFSLYCKCIQTSVIVLHGFMYFFDRDWIGFIFHHISSFINMTDPDLTFSSFRKEWEKGLAWFNRYCICHPLWVWINIPLTNLLGRDHKLCWFQFVVNFVCATEWKFILSLLNTALFTVMLKCLCV